MLPFPSLMVWSNWQTPDGIKKTFRLLPSFVSELLVWLSICCRPPGIISRSGALSLFCPLRLWTHAVPLLSPAADQHKRNRQHRRRALHPCPAWLRDSAQGRMRQGGQQGRQDVRRVGGQPEAHRYLVSLLLPDLVLRLLRDINRQINYVTCICKFKIKHAHL